MVKIQIMSQKVAVDHAAGKDVLVMNSPLASSGATAMERVERIKSLARDCLYLEFHDIFAPRPGLVHPTFGDVQRALEWGKGKDLDEVICVCQAGISRSSAMAFLLTTQQFGPEEAVKVLDINRHSPNPLIVAMGADILGGCHTECIPTASDINRHKHWDLTGCNYNDTARKIMQVYREYADAQQLLYTSDIPLEIIEHKGQEVDTEACQGDAKSKRLPYYLQ